MKNNLSTNYRILMVCGYALVLAGLLLCFNYFFVPGVGTANIVANIILTLTFLVMLWYMLIGHKNATDVTLGIPLFMYAICIIVMNATTTVSISVVTPFITASMGTIVIYPIVIAFNQDRVKLCFILFAVMIISELAHGFFTFFLYAPDGIIDGGNMIATINNIHIFVRSFLTSTMTIFYATKLARSK